MIVTKCRYPNGNQYLLLSEYNQIIGTVQEVDGGYLAHSRRKPVKTLKDAVKQLIDARMNAHRREIDKLQNILNKVLRGE